MPWFTGVLLGAERFMASWHKSQEEASRLRERLKRCWRTKRQRQREETRRRRGAGRERKGVERALASSLSIVFFTFS